MNERGKNKAGVWPMSFIPWQPRCSYRSRLFPFQHPQAQRMASEFVKELKPPGVWVGASGEGPAFASPSASLFRQRRLSQTPCRMAEPLQATLSCGPSCRVITKTPPRPAVGWSRSPEPLLPQQTQQCCFAPMETRTSVQAFTSSLPSAPYLSHFSLPPHPTSSVTPSSLLTWSSADSSLFRPLCLGPDQRSANLFCQGADSKYFRLCRREGLCCSYSTPLWKGKSKHGPGCLCPSKALFMKARGRP